MRISRKTDYATRTVLDLAIHDEGHPVSVSEIAGRTNVPPKFLEQILLQLKVAGLVTSQRGPQGGYRLAVPPEKLTLASLLQITEGAILPMACDDSCNPTACASPSQCSVREVWNEIRGFVVERLESLTVADLALRTQTLRKNEAPDFSI